MVWRFLGRWTMSRFQCAPTVRGSPRWAAYLPRPHSDFPRGSQGTNYELSTHSLGQPLGALLSVPMRVDGRVGLGLLFPGDYLGVYSRGQYLSGSSIRTPPASPSESPDYAGNSAFAVELLADPYGDDTSEGGGTFRRRALSFTRCGHLGAVRSGVGGGIHRQVHEDAR